MEPSERVFTVPPGVPFLPTLAEALVDGRLFAAGGDGLSWADATIYLPTRRAARTFAKVLGERNGGRAQLLPRIVPLGEADEAEFELAASFEAAEALAPPIAPLERRLILARLIQRWADLLDRAPLKHAVGTPLLISASPADAVGLAADLEALMDAFAVEDVPWEDVARAVESEYSEYFGVTLKFLRIAAESWPGILQERGASDAARRRSALVAAEARRLLRDRPRTPIIAAGSTGSIPSTAALIAAIAALPNGAVVLPGLDRDLDEDGWRAVATPIGDGDLVHGHPQTVLRRLLDEHLGVKRSAVRGLGEPGDRGRVRQRLLSEALRPADTTEAWSAMDPVEHHRLALEGSLGLKLVEAADEREEALVAAIALRETLASPGRSAALITPDRSLATRVAAELTRWGIAVEDSAGVPLADTPAGRLARLAADAATHDFHPARVLALFAHPEVRLGLPRSVVEQAAGVLEIGVLRGPRPGPGLQGLLGALVAKRGGIDRHAPRPRSRLTEADWYRAAALLERVVQAFGPFTLEAQGDRPLDLVALSREHRDVVEALREPPPDAPAPELDASHENLDRLFDDLDACDAGGLSGRFEEYREFFAALARQRTVAPATRPSDGGVTILGLLEARLLSFDRVVLGGLDEGVWPPRAETDCFLNRPMRARIGLAPPERRIGQTAHDFVQALGTTDVVITRALKRETSPMVPSRFLQRLKAFAGEGAWTRMKEEGERYRRLARLIDTPAPEKPLAQPAPKPDAALFPRTLSVTEIETLVRDPYAIYARHVLKLDPLDAIAAPPNAATRGTLIHDILGEFTKTYATAERNDAERLRTLGRKKFEEVLKASPDLHAAWWPRFERLADSFIVWDEARRRELAEVIAETSGELRLPMPGGDAFTLRARADRIEARRDGSYAIVDFKTGALPSAKEVFAGFSPQLTLEAAMLMRGGFKNLPAAKDTPELIYVRTTGGRTALDPCPVQPPPGATRTLAEVVDEHAHRLEALVASFLRGEAAYVSRPYAKYARRYSSYDHLARVKEWSLTNGEGEAGE